MLNLIKFSDQIAIWLKDLGYTHYFYVGGGNIMHLTESLSRYLIGIPVVHEVAAGVAAEYFNETASEEGNKALALVTAGPGLTNIITALSGAYLESRELLVIGGQVKTSDLALGKVRSRGIQEVDGVSLVKSTTKCSFRAMRALTSNEFMEKVCISWQPRKGPVFLEIPLDIQALMVNTEQISANDPYKLPIIDNDNLNKVVDLYNSSKKPILLIGGGVDYFTAKKLQVKMAETKVPLMTTYNGADRVDGDSDFYLGRPNTWGQRSANIILQKSDLIIAVGTRLGLQQTGFNWQEFGRSARIVHIDIDLDELEKGHPITDIKLAVDANHFLEMFFSSRLESKENWLSYAKKIRKLIPRIENVNQTRDEYISPYNFILELEDLTLGDDLVIPCSSGSAFTLSMQLYKQKFGQRVITNKSLASMGYGLSGAIGASVASLDKKRTLLIEGDGGFAQNMQELGTAEINHLDLKIFIFNDQGHASIRMTQANYFNGKYLGCDKSSGLGLPHWKKLFSAWHIPVMEITKGFSSNKQFLDLFNKKGLCAFIVKIDPEQTYFPKISSRITKSGSMESNPIDKMSPDIDYLSDLEDF